LHAATQNELAHILREARLTHGPGIWARSAANDAAAVESTLEERSTVLVSALARAENRHDRGA
jgi:hypothetical protein